ncbi:MAG: hypothetical protein ACI36Y_05700, partial [Coriobacteriales bacterium]
MHASVESDGLLCAANLSLNPDMRDLYNAGLRSEACGRAESQQSALEGVWVMLVHSVGAVISSFGQLQAIAFSRSAKQNRASMLSS